MANKPDKFGLKFFHAVDLKTKYLCNGFPYLGKCEERPDGEALAFHVVKKLVAPFENQGHTITADNFFTSLRVVNHLLDHQLSYLGTIRLNKRELPDVATLMKSKTRYSSLFYKTANGKVSLTLYKAKPTKTVALLSSQHSHPVVTQPASEKMKPNVIEDYNHFKCGVDCFDAMARMYSTRCASRRWPLYILFNVLDIAGIKAWILYKEVTKTTISRRQFMSQLIEELLSAPLTMPPHQQARGPSTSNKRHHCGFKNCPNKTTTTCSLCQKHCCGAHSLEKSVTCIDCVHH
jgi:hypothetical protein